MIPTSPHLPHAAAVRSTSATAGPAPDPGAVAAEPAAIRIWLATTPVDMRRSFDSLAEHVRSFLGADPLGGHLFIFRNRSAERLKILWWDGGGLVIYYKRLERGTFPFPATAQHTVALTSTQLLRLLKGLALEGLSAPAA